MKESDTKLKKHKGLKHTKNRKKSQQIQNDKGFAGQSPLGSLAHKWDIQNCKTISGSYLILKCNQYVIMPTCKVDTHRYPQFKRGMSTGFDVAQKY